MTALAPAPIAPLIDPLGRAIRYVRLSVTDRCDLRCVYCMAERQTFLPRNQVLSVDALDRLASVFVDLGARRIRLTGGEPLVRRDVMDLVKRLSRHLASGALEELTLTTNGTRLAEHAAALADHGVRRVNVSLDTRDPGTYRRLTRGGDVGRALDGIAAAHAAGMAVKINVVALRDDNAAELPDLIAWAHGEGHEISLIEAMPIGEIGADRTAQFLSLAEVRRELETRWTLSALDRRTAGPARYVRVQETGGTLGFITPMTHNFCGDCNRVRVTCTGRLYLCLGQDDQADLATALEAGGEAGVERAIRDAVARKPGAHDFRIAAGAGAAVARPMSMTGG
ncbi:cyclic pyranopterin phosphate synthase MoaA [Brevundimonas sp. AAP58]|uniref:GTP 3',8-cyclase MoaA n=1 Tax=Brevundimonas sp. AAP58 TaxID=1523422 RepID=UPI0006B8EF60|nr:GTP 3',8-cyclase MoaA [Brevundimonas sp. AAP58]KPF83227.1 cyclic pyranopterin phosphate synthase MoaA [Brevundimonas sp. AAP58]